MPLILLLLSAQGALLLAAPDETTPHSKSIDACHKTARQIIHRGDLNALGNGKMLTILAPTDLGAEILF
ncbi:hypothetical protein, partial [Salmonella sp. M303]|uniref:hypothetical protein n=1 Tax=Salmonella sp. M303 TaxID=3240309 RepID=UPI00352AF6BA